MELIQKTRQYMADNGIDYLLVNSTNEFLAEYNDLSENSRYLLTDFSGSTGDALLSKEDLFLFVDGRYHTQADMEANKNVSVVKMKLNQPFSECLLKKVKTGKTLALCAKKNSQGRVEILEYNLKLKKIKIKLLDNDPVIELSGKKSPKKQAKAIYVDKKITGLDAGEKFKMISAQIAADEAILVTNCEEISYLCNLREFSSSYSSQIKGKCLITKDSAFLFCDCGVKQFSPEFKIRKLDEFEPCILNLKKIKNIFVDKTSATAYDYRLLWDKAASSNINKIMEMKSIKNKSEILHLKECFKKSDEALDAIREFIYKSGNISEQDILIKLEEEFKKAGAKSLSFKPIVAKNQNSALAHYTKSSKNEIITEGSLVLIDCGAYFEGGYATDMTRVFVKGTPSMLQKKVYTIVLKGFLKAFNKKVTRKTSGFAIDKSARKLLDELAPKGFSFSHALGHGIGISVHESPPSLAPSPRAKTPLKEGMCFTIEPGLYKKGSFGVRIENTCHLEKIGAKYIIKSFSDMCFEEKLIDFTMLTSTEKKQLKSFEVK